jgi:hypothetical protein
MTAALAHFVVREPSPILVLMPTEADCSYLGQHLAHLGGSR